MASARSGRLSRRMPSTSATHSFARAPIIRTTNGYGSLTRAALLQSRSLLYLAAFSGGRVSSRCAAFLSHSLSSRYSPCHSTILRPPLWVVLLRAIWLALALYFATTLSAAEWHYAAAFAVQDVNQTRAALDEAKALYPFAARFRE